MLSHAQTILNVGMCLVDMSADLLDNGEGLLIELKMISKHGITVLIGAIPAD